MAIDYSLFKYAKHTPSVVERHRKDVEADAKLEKAYAKVDARDGKMCAVTGLPLVPFASDESRCLEHHHLKGRRVRPEWVTDSRRIISVSKRVHRLLTANALKTDDTDARKTVRFYWNRRIVKPGKEPFRLRTQVAVCPCARVLTRQQKNQRLQPASRPSTSRR